MGHPGEKGCTGQAQFCLFCTARVRLQISWRTRQKLKGKIYLAFGVPRITFPLATYVLYFLGCEVWAVNKETFTLPLSLPSPDVSHAFMNGLWKEFQELHFVQVMHSRHLSIKHWPFLWLLYTCCYMRATVSKLFYFLFSLFTSFYCPWVALYWGVKKKKKVGFILFSYFFLLVKNSSRAIKQEKETKIEKNPANHWSCRLARQN